MSRLVTVNTALGCAFGVACSLVGFSVWTWQYWLLFGLFLAVMINSLIQD